MATSMSSSPTEWRKIKYARSDSVDLLCLTGLTLTSFLHAQILLGDGSGGFATSNLPATPGLSFSFGGGAKGAATGDFNGDGIHDVVVPNSEGAEDEIFLCDGVGGFSSILLPGGTGDSACAATDDFNNDGNVDIVLGGFLSLKVLLGNGQAGFTLSTPGQSLAFGVTTGDFNGDDNADIYTARIANRPNEMLLGDGQGGFTSAMSVRSDYSRGATKGDFNGDGVLDIFISNEMELNEMLLGSGQGGFTSTLILPHSDQSMAATAGDFNGDGIEDVFVANGQNTGVYASGKSCNFSLLFTETDSEPAQDK